MSSAAISVHEHVVPPGATILHPRVCQNCGRSAFIHIDSKHPYCCDCSHVLTQVENQLWECLRCGTVRAWGTGAPYETAEKYLNCAICHEVKKHGFKKVVI